MLGVVEIGRHGNHRLRDVAAEIGFCGFLHPGSRVIQPSLTSTLIRS
jgi:hypothetical protein